MKRPYTNDENTVFKEINTSLDILGERTKRLKGLIEERKKKGYYNLTERDKLLKTIKTAKLNIANAEFI